jgi:hypothetical protein
MRPVCGDWQLDVALDGEFLRRQASGGGDSTAAADCMHSMPDKVAETLVAAE